MLDQPLTLGRKEQSPMIPSDAESQVWMMPEPPPRHVRTVRDCYDVEYWRSDEDGFLWNHAGADYKWGDLVYRLGPIYVGLT
jgi:hypothetical protein